MKRLLLTLTLIISANAWAEDMISLPAYLDKHKDLDINNLFYIYARCSAVNNKVWVLSKDSSKFKDALAKPSLEMFERYYVEAGNILTKISGKKPEEIRKNLKATITGMIEEYTTMSDEHFIKTGDFFLEQMTEDANICTQLFIDTFNESVVN